MKRTPFLLTPFALLVLLVAGCAGSRTTTAPQFADAVNVVAVVGGEPITIDEFERRYAKSAGGVDEARADSLEAYQDFLNRYVEFRMKVRAGIDAGLPEDPELSDEIEQYRRSFARPYLLEREVLEPIIRDIYERQKELVKASHILVQVSEHALPADTLDAYNRLAALVDSVEAGADFGDVAFRHSEDPSAQRPEGQPGSHGSLGYFTAGQMVEPFETFAFETPVGGMSPIFRTPFGYHVLVVEDRIEAPAPIRLSHILIATASRTDAEARALADSIAQRARAGESFGALAREFSDDPQSAQMDGELGFMEYSMPIIEPFKQAAFAMGDVGEISDPVETPFGYHVIKLMERREPATYEEVFERFKDRVSRMPRAQEAERALAMQIRQEHGARIDTLAIRSLVQGFDVDELAQAVRSDSLASDVLDQPVASFGGETVRFADVADEISSGRAGEAADAAELVLAAADRVLHDRAIDAGSRALESRDREFGDLMQEFREGLILFRFMEDSVWTAAAQDSAALYAIWSENPDAYRYEDRTRVISVSAPRDSLIQAFGQRFDALGLDAALEAATDLRVDTTLLVGPTNTHLDAALGLTEGSRTEATRERGRYIVLINGGVVPARTKTFEEARPEVVSKYQQQYEQRLIERLRRRYAVQMFPEKLENAFRTATLSMTDAR